MTAPQQQKLKIKGPVVITGNRLGDGAVVYRTQDRGWSTQLDDAYRHHRGRARDRASEGSQCKRHRGGRRLCRAGHCSKARRIKPGNLRERIRQHGPTFALPGAGA